MRKPAPIQSANDTANDGEGPSKSELKRQSTALQKIGKTLVDMPFDKVKRSPASPELLEAIRECQRIRSHEGRRRQLQYIGKLMRDEDGERLEKWINGETLDQRLEVTRMHAAEAWRDRLIAEPTLLAEFIRHYPDALDADLHTLIRNARTEKERNKPPKAARELYQIIKTLVTRSMPANEEDEPDDEDAQLGTSNDRVLDDANDEPSD